MKSFIVTFFKGQRVVANPNVQAESALEAEKKALSGFDYGIKGHKRFDPPAKEEYDRIATHCPQTVKA